MSRIAKSSSSGKAKNRVLMVRDAQLDNIPPPISSQNRFGMTFRFNKTNASNANVTQVDLMNLMVFAATSTTGYSMYDAFKLRKIRLYQLPLINTSSAGVAISPLKITYLGVVGTNFGSDRVVQGYPGAQGAKISLKPPPPCDDWISVASAGTMFTISGPIGVLVDVDMTIQMRGGQTAVPSAVTSTGASAGQVYGNYLDSSGTQFLQNYVAANNALVWA